MGVVINDNIKQVIYKTPIMLIDSSYLTFNRFYATIKMYTAKHNRPIETSDVETVEFMDMFTKNYFKSLKKMIKRFKIKFINVYFVRDCPRKNIWRIREMKTYKKNRGETIKYKNKHFNVGKIFKYVYSSILPFIVKNYRVNIIQVKQAEADDIIAVMTSKYSEIDVCNIIYIISEDKDMYQLLKYSKVRIYNMKFKQLGLNIDPQDILMKKILMGDRSDNIPGLLIKDIDIDKIESINDIMTFNFMNKHVLTKNRKIIDFDYIPTNIVNRICIAVNNLQLCI